ncbi:hypothetical protein [Lapillicoccus sp.]|uniref:hypothetical protein n=1 Tax=Lapillicoccus sp. TaxID=1909287 RepID=UPI003983A487
MTIPTAAAEATAISRSEVLILEESFLLGDMGPASVLKPVVIDHGAKKRGAPATGSSFVKRSIRADQGEMGG